MQSRHGCIAWPIYVADRAGLAPNSACTRERVKNTLREHPERREVAFLALMTKLARESVA